MIRITPWFNRLKQIKSLDGKRRIALFIHRALHSMYAVGEGWTGALGTNRIDQTIRGHFDDLEDAVDLAIQTLNYPYECEIHDAALGWGHSAAILSTREQPDPMLYVTGRPHDFSSLLRLRRLPRWLRTFSSQQTLENSVSAHGGSVSSLQINPAAIIDRILSNLSDKISGPYDWEAARSLSFLTTWTPIHLPDDDKVPVSVSCSAGLTAVITQSGCLYCFGLNGFGQCGIGQSGNNVWLPSRVTGLSFNLALSGPRYEIEQSIPIKAVSLGLQHGVCLNEAGEVFAFGKGDRGQLGQNKVMDESHFGVPIRRACIIASDGKPEFTHLSPVTEISTGMLHCALLTDDNKVLVFGKHMLHKSHSQNPHAPAADAKLPVVVSGFPSNMKVLQIASGSHHTSVLLEDGSIWGFGISNDTKELIHEPIEMIAGDIVRDLMPLSQFTAHMDRTTIVGSDGRTVLQVQLWSDTSMREYAIFSPSWVDRLLREDMNLRIQSVHRSWIHSMVVAVSNTALNGSGSKSSEPLSIST